jgi:peptide/nickel transport system ATP-binding protein
MAMAEEMLLQVESLSIAYGEKQVVSDVSFGLSRGRCLGVIGESGAGKSQAFLALTRLLPAEARVAGRAELAGMPLLGSAASVRRGRDIAMIFQDPMTSLTPHLRVGIQIAESLVTHRDMSWRDARLRAAQLLDQVGIGDVPRRIDQYPHELSGGMRQRVMIAMALACEPKVLIADEPTTALDVSVQAQILALLRRLIAERHMALAVITHDMGVIAALADEVLVMQGGRIVERGAVSQVLEAPRHEHTRVLLAATPQMNGALRETAPSGAPALQVKDLGVRYRQRARLRHGWLRRTLDLVAVESATFEVGAGESLGIVGESGSGKSTLVRALLQLGPVSAGEILWLGRATREIETAELRGAMQIVFQDPFASLDPTMTVSECVAEPLRALRPSLDAAARDAQVVRMLESVGLDGSFARRKSTTLSGGQCQRVAIARAMIIAPKLLVCDEAVSALDVSIQAQILELLAAMRSKHGASLIFVSHNLAVVRSLCDRVLVMYLGRIVESGPTESVFRAPRHPYTRMLLDSVPLLDPGRERQRLESLAVHGETPSAVDRPPGCEYHQRCPAARERCAAQRPETELLENSRQVACWRWRELAN